ncbi:MFS transporter [Trueperella abortisuis]|uniref:MFS transporter n=1 Tax=Trueperella abortisuis TaxID=445930 RepID=UPI0028933EBE|nr:MFS transporter [Trueperella abortisuis]
MNEQTPMNKNVWSYPGFTNVMVAIFAAFGCWALLLPVIPQAIIESGGSAGLAGASTGVFMGVTVIAQTQTPRIIRRFGYVPTMAFSGVLLGIPSLIHIFTMSAPAVFAVAALRGIGFGTLCVAESALVASLVPLKLLGRASGTLGAMVGLGELVMLPLGLVVASSVGSYAPVYIIATVLGLAGTFLVTRIPHIEPPKKHSQKISSARVPTWKLVAVPAAAMCFTAMGFGGISAFLAPAVTHVGIERAALIASLGLSVVGLAQMICRYAAGIFADAKGAGRLIVWASLTSAIGLAGIAAILITGASGWLLFFALIAYGAGFGIVQNEALLLMFGRLSKDRNEVASAIWNASFDSGTGIGSFLLGGVATIAVGSSQFFWVFVAASALVAVAFLVTLADLILGNHRIAEENNLRAVIRRMIGALHITAIPKR